MFALSLMPSLSRAVAHWRGDDALREVCSTTRLFASNEAGQPGDTLHALGHCPYCALAATPLLPPSADAAPVAHPALRHAMPPRYFSAARSGPAWRSAQPRGPPTVLS